MTILSLTLATWSIAASAPFTRVEPVGVAATSSLKDSGNKHEENWLPQYAADDDPNTAWVEGKPDYGIGEVLTFTLTPVTGASNVKLVFDNGFEKSDALFVANSAPTKVHVTVTGNGAVVGENDIVLLSKMRDQEFVVPVKGVVDAVALRIDDVRKGKLYKDTCISDVQIFVDTTVDEAMQKKNRAALDAWREPRLIAATVADSDFIAGKFVDAGKKKGTGEAFACVGKDVDAMLTALPAFLDGTATLSGTYIATPDQRLPVGFHESDVITHVDLSPLKPLKDGGRHRREPRACCPECIARGGKPSCEEIDLFVLDPDANGTRYAYTGLHRIDSAPYGDVGVGYALDRSGHVVAIAAYSEGLMSQFLARFHWTETKIDAIELWSPDCTADVMKPAPN